MEQIDKFMDRTFGNRKKDANDDSDANRMPTGLKTTKLPLIIKISNSGSTHSWGQATTLVLARQELSKGQNQSSLARQGVKILISRSL